MTSSRTRRIAWMATLLCALVARDSIAQSLGTVRWQLQPFCNVVTLSVTQTGGFFTLDGFDDLCGAAQRAPAVGIAVPNPNGSFGLGLTVVLAPGAAPIHVDATVQLPTISGSWRDDAGNTGAFVFNPAIAPGPPRPPPRPVFATGLSAGNTTIINVGAPINATDAATKGYVDATVGAAVPPPNQFTFQADGGFVARGVISTGVIPATGSGLRLMWYPRKGALRAGLAVGSQWDDASVGQYSVAVGSNVTASSSASVALGANNVASGFASVALGNQTTASGFSSTALGQLASTDGFDGAFVYGDLSTNTSVVRATADNQFTVRAEGGVRFFTSVDTVAPAPGAQLAAGGSSWIAISDVRSKTNFRDLDGEIVLSKLSAMPIREWSYRAQDAAIRHVGPTAQDFYAAFGLGEDPLGIGTIDADGIALRAIQALELRTRQLTEENRTLKLRLAAIDEALTRRGR